MDFFVDKDDRTQNPFFFKFMLLCNQKNSLFTIVVNAGNRRFGKNARTSSNLGHKVSQKPHMLTNYDNCHEQLSNHINNDVSPPFLTGFFQKIDYEKHLYIHEELWTFEGTFQTLI